MDGGRQLLTRGKKVKDQDEELAKEAELFQQYCFAEAWRLRASADGAGSGPKKNLSFYNAGEL